MRPNRQDSPNGSRADAASDTVVPLVEPLEGRQLLHAGHEGVALPTNLRIEVGNSTGYTDTTGRFWDRDQGFASGTASTGAYSVSNTSDDKLYYTRRWGNFDYALPVADGAYTLRLHFADSVYTASGQRKFDVFAEGGQILNDFDIAANGGGKRAIVKTFNVTINDAALHLNFRNVLDNALLSAIELTPGQAPTSPPPSPSEMTAAPLDSGRVWLTWKDNSRSETHFRIERSTNGGSFVHLMNVGGDLTSVIDTTVQPNTTYSYRARAVNQVGASAASNTATTRTPAASPGSGFTQIDWSNRKSASWGKVESLGAVVDGKLYTFGGFRGDEGPVTDSEVYNPATDTWSRVASLPGRITHAGVAVDGRNIYIAGGYLGIGPGYHQQFGITDAYKYNVDTNQWSRLPSLPVRIASGGLAVVGRNLHYFGGNDANRNDTGAHFVLNLDGGTSWTAAPSMPNPRSHFGYAALGGKIYVIGGQTGNDEGLIAQSHVSIYDTVSKTWSAGPSMPRALSHIGGSTLVMEGRIIVAGGEFEHVRSVSDVRAYDPASRSWTQLSNLPGSRFSGVAGEIGGNIYFTGGSALTNTWKGTPVR